MLFWVELSLLTLSLFTNPQTETENFNSLESLSSILSLLSKKSSQSFLSFSDKFLFN